MATLPPPVPPPPPPPSEAVMVELDAPPQLERWRPLVQWLLALPHHVVAYFLQIASGAVWAICAVSVLFTRKVPPGLADFQVMSLRYRSRVQAYSGFAHASYPKFEYQLSAPDPGGDPLHFSIVPQRQEMNRWLPLYNWFIAIPHYVMLMIYGIAAAVLWILNFFIVLFTGSWNANHRAFIVKVWRYGVRVVAYVILLRDDYPEFGLR